MGLCYDCCRFNLFQNDSFPSQGGIIAFDQLTFFSNNSQVTGSIPLLGETPHPYQHVREGFIKDLSLMGTFYFAPPLHYPLLDNSNPVSYINMISSCITPHDHWIVPDSYNIDTFCGRMLLSLIEL